MPKRGPKKLIYLLADGAHARIVEQSSETGHFVTVSTLDGTAALEVVRAEQRDEQPGRSFESGSAARHGVGGGDAYRRAKAEFAHKAASALNRELAREARDAVVLVAPARLLPALREHLHAPVAAELAKDLIKVPDHDLGQWLHSLSLAGEAAP